MTRHPSHRSLAGALLLGLAFHGACQANEPFESELARLAGRTATQCGIFPLGKPVAAADWACAQKAERARQPYWIAVSGPGDDSMVGRAAIRTPDGVHILLVYDSDPSGGRKQHPRFIRTVCAWPVSYDPRQPVPFDCPSPQGGR